VPRSTSFGGPHLEGDDEVSLEENVNGNKLYVGGLPYSTSDTQLEELFSAHGTVESARVITDRMTGRSKGFGFVEMSSDAEARAAAEKLNGTDLGGRTLVVSEARPREARGGGGGGFGGGGGGGGRGRGGGGGGGRNRW
jgi:RNA recognition motif-containing protein